MENFEQPQKNEQLAMTGKALAIQPEDQRLIFKNELTGADQKVNEIFGNLQITGLSDSASTSKLDFVGKSGLDRSNSISESEQAKLSDRPMVIARVSDQEMNSLNKVFDARLEVMKAIGHHQEGMGWAQNFAEVRKCYNQASEMGQSIRNFLSRNPMGQYLEVNMGTIHEGKGSNPVDFYTGRGEHNFIVITDKRDGSQIYADPWKGIRFTRNPSSITGGAEIKIKDFND